MGRVENVVDSTRFDRFETNRLPWKAVIPDDKNIFKSEQHKQYKIPNQSTEFLNCSCRHKQCLPHFLLLLLILHYIFWRKELSIETFKTKRLRQRRKSPWKSAYQMTVTSVSNLTSEDVCFESLKIEINERNFVSDLISFKIKQRIFSKSDKISEWNSALQACSNLHSTQLMAFAVKLFTW